MARVGGVTCGLPIEHVVETMRPLPIVPLGRSGDEALALIEGLAVIRGAPVPVVDTRRLLGVTGGRATRFVIVRTAERRIALVVDAVVDVRRIDPDALAQLPPLLRAASSDRVVAIGVLDAGLLVVLDAARVIPEASWRVIDQRGDRSRAP